MKKQTKKYIKSPLNYTGGKYKLLSQIIPLFPKNIDTFYDIFGGGFNVGINVNCNQVIYNDINTHVVKILQTFANTDIETIVTYIKNNIDTFQLAKDNEAGFLEFRKVFNESNDINYINLYSLICYSFNYQLRFNKQGKYNSSFGRNRSSFSKVLENKLRLFVNKLHDTEIEFMNTPFNQLDLTQITTNDFIYLDPPYLSSTATYNENGGWTIDDEQYLLDTLLQLHNKNIRFALSNNLQYDNPLLKEWIQTNGFKVIYLYGGYNNCNYHKKDKDIKNRQEVLIMNYDANIN